MNASPSERRRILGADATEQARLVREGLLSQRELAELSIDRIEETNPELGAVVYLDPYALEPANPSPLDTGAPFDGVPLLLKDLGVAAAGHPDHRGNAMRRRAGLTFGGDSATARRLREAGLRILGRTNSAEFGLYSDTDNPAYGTTRNPWDPERSAGGSSGGSASAVAAGMVAVAQGTDGGGSVRNPAAHCGLVGLKPSRGLISSGPQMGESMFGVSQTGMLTRSVRDAAALLGILAGTEVGDPVIAPNTGADFLAEADAGRRRLRIGILDHDPERIYDVDPEIAEAVRATGRLLEDLGHHVETSWPQAMFEDGYVERWFDSLLPFALIERENTARLVGGDPDFAPITEFWYRAALDQAPGQHLRAMLWIEGFRRRVQDWWTRYDVLLSPVIPELPRPAAFLSDGRRGIEESIAILRFTRQFNSTGQPAISVPAGMSTSGLPLAVQLAGPYGGDGLLLDLAAQLEEARPWRRSTLAMP